MFPHDKLDWTLARLTKRVEDPATEPETRLAFARAAVSRARFHGGEDRWFHDALTQARRVLHHEPGHPEAVLLAGLSLVLLDRAEAAERYLDEVAATLTEDPRLHLTLGERALQDRDTAMARHHFEEMVRLAPTSWEAHGVLGELLAARIPDDAPVRAVEHASYHLVRALQLGPSSHVRPDLYLALSGLCLRAGRDADADRLLHLLTDDPRHGAVARFHLGRVAARAGKHKKAILFYRQYLDGSGRDDPDAWCRIGSSYLHLGEPSRAREACNHALAVDGSHLEARWILGSALVAEDRPEDGVRVFRELLEMAPDHADAFAELVRMRAVEGDVRWTRQALRSETAVYDRLPVAVNRRASSRARPVEIDPRAATRARIDVLIQGLGRIDPEVTQTVLSCLDLTTDEGLRYHLWEGVLTLLARQKADDVRAELADVGERFGPELGRDVMLLADDLSGDLLVPALSITEDDLRAAAVHRHGPADDVTAHRRHVEEQQRAARAWQGMVLLALARSDSPDVRALLVRWSHEADDELGLAAKAALAMLGDAEAREVLHVRAAEQQLDHLVHAMVAASARPRGPTEATLTSDRDDLTCATCGRRGTQVSHMVWGHGTAVCSVCTQAIAERRRELETREPEVACALTGATLLDTPALYVYQGVPISHGCIELSVGHEEREVVASYLASL